jgi:hypothetical protein
MVWSVEETRAQRKRVVRCRVALAFGRRYRKFELTLADAVRILVAQGRGSTPDDRWIRMKPQTEPSLQEVLAGFVERITFHNGRERLLRSAD